MAAGSSSSIMRTNFLILAHMAVFSELSTGCVAKIGYYIRGLCILMRCPYGLDLGNGLGGLGLVQHITRNTLTSHPTVYGL